MHVNTDNLLSELPKGIYSNSVAGELRIFLDQAWKKYHAEYLNAVKESEAFYTSMELSLRDQEDFAVMKNKYVNKQLSEILRNENELVEYIVYDNEIVRLRDPVYTLPWLNNGRAHFYAPYKKIMGMYIDTFWFNLLVIWIFTGLWFIILYYDLLRKLITYFENLQLQRFNRRILRILKQQNENR